MNVTAHRKDKAKDERRNGKFPFQFGEQFDSFFSA
jgi:hypothetical protein